MMMKQTKGKQLMCELCRSHVNGKAAMEVHMRSHLGEKPFLCEICGQGFTQKGNLNKHRNLCRVLPGTNTQLGEQSTLAGKTIITDGEKAFECHICQEKFENRKDVKRHLHTHIAEESLYQCELCNKQFRNKGTLQSHLRIHSGSKPFKCNLCDKRFTQNSQRNVHIKAFHNRERKHTCKECSKMFVNKGHLQRHMNTHTGIKPYVCSICQKAFSRKYQLSTHVRNRDATGHSCSSCDKVFCTSHDLKCHMKIHVGTISQKSEDNCPSSICYGKDNKLQGIVQDTMRVLDVVEGLESAESDSHAIDDILTYIDTGPNSDSLPKNSESELLYFEGKIDVATSNNPANKNESVIDNFNASCLPTTHDTSVPTENEQNAFTSIDDQESVSWIKVDQADLVATLFNTRVEKMDPIKNLDENCLEKTITQSTCSAFVNEADKNHDSNNTNEQSKAVNASSGHELTADTVRLFDASFNQNQPEHIPVTMKVRTVKDVTDNIVEQSSDVAKTVHENKINICSVQNVQIYTAKSVYTHSEQNACVLKICGEKGIQVQKECRSSQILEPVRVETRTSHCSLETGRQLDNHHKGLDFHLGTFHNKNCFFDQSADKFSLNSSSGFIDDAVTVESELGFVHLPSNPDITEKDCELNIHKTTNDQKYKCIGSVKHKEKECVYYGPQTCVEDSLAGYDCFQSNENINQNMHGQEGLIPYGPANRNENMSQNKQDQEDLIQFCPANINDENKSQNKQDGEDLIPYGPANFNENDFENFGQYETNVKDFKLYGPANIHEHKLISYGPANINENDFVSYEHLKVRGKDFVFSGPANVNEKDYVSDNHKNLGKKDLVLNASENITANNFVQYGPLNFNESSYVKVNDDVPYGPANIDEDDFVRVKDFEINGQTSTDKKHIISEDIPQATKQDFMTFSDNNSISDNKAVPSGPLNAYDQYTLANKTDLVQYGPENNNKNMHNSGIYDEENSVQNVENADFDYLNCSLVDFQGVSCRVPKPADRCIFPEKFDTVLDHDYTTFRNEEQRNVKNGLESQECVHDITDNTLTCKSCKKTIQNHSSLDFPVSNNASLQNQPHSQSINCVLSKSDAHIENTCTLIDMSDSHEAASAVADLLSNDSNITAVDLELTDVSADNNDTHLVSTAVVGDIPTSSSSGSFISKNSGKSSQKLLSCEICCIKMPNKYSLEQHLLTHSELKPFTCGICQRSFTEKSSLNVHMKMCKILNATIGVHEQGNNVTIFTGDSPFMCSVCKERFSHKSSLKRHVLSHIEQKLFQCDICNKQFRHKGTLQSHRRTHTGERPFKCKFCDKCFQQSGQLGVHTRSCHTGEKPYVCDICNKGFSDKSHLQRHLVIHSGKKQFVCDVCKKAFGQRYQLKKHMQCHSENKEDICDICHRSFCSKSSLQRHMLIHTNQ